MNRLSSKERYEVEQVANKHNLPAPLVKKILVGRVARGEGTHCQRHLLETHGFS